MLTNSININIYYITKEGGAFKKNCGLKILFIFSQFPFVSLNLYFIFKIQKKIQK